MRRDRTGCSKDADFADLTSRGLLERTFIWIRVRNLSNDLLWQRIDQTMPDIESAVAVNARIIEVR
ncbi:MAG: hypothetical protein B7Z15_23775 [Rhizobiales bacterium 32-66-8]|nr:MAG: hypothetical protein B7Z15_23775 [Rhizobiales bacterium 32-66-8]